MKRGFCYGSNYFLAQDARAKDPAADYSEGASHVLAVIHDILAHHRNLESKWHAKKIKLHQRLALRLFQEDVKQVLDWLQNHGEVFLRKNVGIGRNLQKAKAYQKSHETFEGVVQVSIVQRDIKERMNGRMEGKKVFKRFLLLPEREKLFTHFLPGKNGGAAAFLAGEEQRWTKRSTEEHASYSLSDEIGPCYSVSLLNLNSRENAA